MGNYDTKTEISQPFISLKDFRLLNIIGRGGFGKVWAAETKVGHRLYAIKEMMKTRIIKRKSVKSILNERFLLSMIKHPFIVNIQYAFQDRLNLYLVMDLVTGGDLRYHLSNKKVFDEPQTKFIISCILMGLEYLHVNGIIHRDIKPENLVFDSKGYIRIIDFGIANTLGPDNSKDTSGTPGYMSPEVILGKNHGVETDYFALGVIAYECMLGRRPYFGRSRKEVKEHMLSTQVQLKRKDVPEGWSLEAADFINKLLQRNKVERLGFKGPQEVKTHAWLDDIQWKKLLEKTIEAPFKPSGQDNFNPKVQEEWRDDTKTEVNLHMVQNCFKDYNFERSFQSRGQESTLNAVPKLK
jgi:protein kinase A